MKIDANERKLLETERKDYQQLLEEVSKPRISNRNNAIITCIGNAAGSDSIIHGKPSAGMLFRFKNRSIIVDPGENCLSLLAEFNFDPYQLTDVVASHSHNDHIGDLSSIISSTLQLNLIQNKDKNILIAPTLADYQNPEATRFGFTLPVYAWEGNVKVIFWENKEVTRFDGIKILSEKTVPLNENIAVTSVEGRHSKMPVSGYIFDTSFGKLGYTGDTEYFPEMENLYKGCEILWMNINTLGLESMTDCGTQVPVETSFVKNHLGYAGVCKLIETVKPTTAIISHFGSQLLSKIDTIQDVLRERFSNQGVNIFCVNNGDEFRFEQSFKQVPETGKFSL